MLIILGLILMIVVVLVGGDRGAMSLIALAGNILCLSLAIWLYAVGAPVFLVTAGAGILISCITLFYQNGTNIKTWSAFLAVAITMCVLFAFIYLVVWKSGAGGLNEIQAAGEDVFYYNMNLDISMPKVATAVIVLSTLGAVIDMALTVTTSVYEVKCHKPDIKMNKLVQSGMKIGKDVIVPVTADMLVAVGEGDYTLRISKNGYSGEKSIRVTKDRELNVDISDIAIPSGTVTFAVTPEDANEVIKVDGEVIANRTYTGLYGDHELSITADGYDSFRGSFKITETMKTLRVTLQQETTEETTEDTTEATTQEGQTTASGQITTQTTATTQGSQTTTATTQSGQTTESAEQGNKITIKKPEGVGVYFDGDYVGIAPVSIRKTAGTHTITLYKAGYLIKSYTIQAEDNGKDDEYSYADLISVLD